MPAKFHQFTVEGKGAFPIDMLRFDSCWPKSESGDSVSVMASFERYNKCQKNTVTLVGISEPTAGRWASFGWRVL